jgi:hypothetical protein
MEACVTNNINISISPHGIIRKNKANNKAQACFYKVSPVKERENE